MSANKVYIIGSGMAGTSAALWTRRVGLEPVVLEKTDRVGGQLHEIIYPIPDYPGFTGNGSLLSEKLTEQLREQKVEVRYHSEVTWIGEREVHIRGLRGEVYRARFDALVLASGLRRRSLPVAQQNVSGIFYSASAHLEQFQGARVAIVGGGDGALENALKLVPYAKEIHLLIRSTRIRARQHFLDEADAEKKISIHTQTVVDRIQGSDRLQSLQLTHKEDGPFVLPVDRLLVKIGFEPVTDFVPEAVEQSDGGYIQVDPEQRTSVESIWAAGDVCTPMDPGLAVSAGQGCLAARSIERSLA